MQKRNKNIDTEPRVGIFWLFNGQLILDSVPLSKAERYGDSLTYSAGHIDHWAVLQQRGEVPMDVEYDEPPRGRVGYDTKHKEVLMFADQCIIDNRATVRAIVRAFHLPEDSEPRTDLQYRCPVCLSGRCREED